MTQVWERTDDPFCSVKWVASDTYYFNIDPTSHRPEDLAAADAAKGAGWWLVSDDGDREFKVDDVVRQPLSDEEPVRVRSAVKPPFGEWAVVEV